MPSTPSSRKTLVPGSGTGPAKTNEGPLADGAPAVDEAVFNGTPSAKVPKARVNLVILIENALG